MREAAKELKQAVVALLNGNIGAPVWDGKVEGSENTYVLMTLSGENNTSNKTRQVTEGTLELSITNIRHATAQSEVIEDVADSIKQELDAAITLPSPFNVTYFRFDNAGTVAVREMGNAKFAHTKPLTYRFRITQ